MVKMIDKDSDNARTSVEEVQERSLNKILNLHGGVMTIP